MADSSVTLTVNGRSVSVSVDDRTPAGGSGRGPSLLDVLRFDLGLLSVKDGCSPQGQCGCCTVLVDGQPRVACVTPVRRVRDRTITTLEGLDERAAWAEAFCATGASQCGFCTPGIIMRLAGSDSPADENGVHHALLAHLCRCTGWQTIPEACRRFHGLSGAEGQPLDAPRPDRDLEAATRRATIEGGVSQTVDPAVALGRGGFASDTAPADALVAVLSADGTWVVAESVAEARSKAGKVQGRRTTAAPTWPLETPNGEWNVTLRTTWVDPAYLETDASWCRPGGKPYSTVANGGAFGAKAENSAELMASSTVPTHLDVATVARSLADEHDHPVLVLASREDVARFGVKRPPLAAGMNAEGLVSLRVVATPGINAAIADGFRLAGYDGEVLIEEVAVPGPPTSTAVRAAGWAEARVLIAGATGRVGVVRSPSGAEAEAEVDLGGDAPAIRVAVRCGRILDEVVLRSYCIGAAHMAWSWLTSEALAVDETGVVHDLTVRSFGVLRAVDTPRIDVELVESDDDPVDGSDAVFTAVAAAGWLARGCPSDWPIGLS